MKEIEGNGRNTLDGAIKRQKRQANNFIFDITNSNINKVDKVIVKDRENVLVIFKKRPAATLRVTTSHKILIIHSNRIGTKLNIKCKLL